MFLLLALLVIAILFCMKKKGSTNPRFAKTTTYKIFSETGGMDKVLRVIQYVCSWIIGHLEEQSNSQSSFLSLLLSGKADSVGKTIACVSRLRKMIRFLRAPMLFLTIKTKKIELNFKNQIETLSTLKNLCIYLSQIADFIFFFTDHYQVFTLLGVLNNKPLLASLISLGNYMWVTNAVFLAISAILSAIVTKRMHPQMDLRKSKSFYFIIGDFLASCIELFVGLTFINPQLASRKIFSSLILMGCGYKLSKMVMI